MKSMRNIHKKRIVEIIVICLFLIASFLAWADRSGHFSNNTLKFWVFNVGQGDALFIETPEGHQLLIDGGPSGIILEKLGQVLPFWDHSIDQVVLTHPHADHVSGLVSVVEYYDVGTVYGTGVLYDSVAYEEFLSLAEIQHLVQGDILHLENDLVIEVVYPDQNLDGVYMKDINRSSIVLKIIYGNHVFLLTGDGYIEDELDYLDQIGDIDVLKVGHQGSKTSTSKELLNETTPEIAIISVGENDYGHPYPLVLRKLEEIDAQILRTDLHGDIRVISDGNKLDIQSYNID